MADIDLTASKIAPVYSDRSEIYNHIAAADLNAGDFVTFNATGGVIKADANDTGANTFKGVALQTVKSGQAVAVLYRGYVTGFTISGLNVGASVFVSDTAGAGADAAGTKSIVAGIVGSDSNKNKILFITGWAG